jgi:hypothetical protein
MSMTRVAFYWVQFSDQYSPTAFQAQVQRRENRRTSLSENFGISENIQGGKIRI